MYNSTGNFGNFIPRTPIVANVLRLICEKSTKRNLSYIKTNSVCSISIGTSVRHRVYRHTS